MLRESKSELIHLNCMLGPLNWNLAETYHHSSQLCGKDLTLDSTFRVLKIITQFKNKSSQAHAQRRMWLLSVLTVQRCAKDLLWLFHMGCCSVGLCWNQRSPTCLKAQLHSGELLLLIAGSIPLLGSHPGCSYLLLMLLMLLLGMRDPISWALCCLHWRQCYNSHWSQQQQKQQPQPLTSECRDAHRGYSCLWEAF